MIGALLDSNMQCRVNYSGVGMDENAKSSGVFPRTAVIRGFRLVFFDVIKSKTCPNIFSYAFFDDYTLACFCFLVAIRQSFSDVTDYQIKIAVIDILKHVKDREGGRKRRQEAKENDRFEKTTKMIKLIVNSDSD